MASMAEKPKQQMPGCAFVALWVVLVPTGAALLASGDIGWIVGGVGVAAMVLIALVTLAAFF